MKVFHILALVFISVVFSNCSKSKEDSLPPRLYDFYLKFVDADNNNILGDKDVVASKQNFWLDKESETDVDKWRVNRENIGDEVYLKVSAASLPELRLEKIIYNGMSKELFNDNKEHKIETVWRAENNYDNVPAEIVLDGKKLKLEVVNSTFCYFLVKK